MLQPNPKPHLLRRRRSSGRGRYALSALVEALRSSSVELGARIFGLARLAEADAAADLSNSVLRIAARRRGAAMALTSISSSFYFPITGAVGVLTTSHGALAKKIMAKNQSFTCTAHLDPVDIPDDLAFLTGVDGSAVVAFKSGLSHEGSEAVIGNPLGIMSQLSPPTGDAVGGSVGGRHYRSVAAHYHRHAVGGCPAPRCLMLRIGKPRRALEKALKSKASRKSQTRDGNS